MKTNPNTITLSPDAKEALDLIGKGWRLRIPFSGYGPTLVNAFPTPDGPKDEPRPVSVPAVRELLDSYLLHRMERGTVNNRRGWLEAGLDGDQADFYCMTI
jgi:hypothetical protein